MAETDTLDRAIFKELEAFLVERRVRLQESVRARMIESRTAEPRRDPEYATTAAQSLDDDFEMTMLDRQSRETAQIDAALERLAQGEYGSCRTCGAFIGLGRLKALPIAQRCTACEAGVEAHERRAEAERWTGSIRGRKGGPFPPHALRPRRGRLVVAR